MLSLLHTADSAADSATDSSVLSSAAMLSSSWPTLLAPISTDVIRGSRNAQTSMPLSLGSAA